MVLRICHPIMLVQIPVASGQVSGFLGLCREQACTPRCRRKSSSEKLSLLVLSREYGNV